MTVPIEWLKTVDQELRNAGVEQRKRPWEASRRYSLQFRISVDISSSMSKEIFEWFEARSKPSVHRTGGSFETVYYFDTEFWTVSIPVIFGTVRVDALDCLREMPQSVKADLVSGSESAWDYVLYWADCLDYAMGINEVGKTSKLNTFGLQLLKAGDQELRSAITQLRETRPDPRAILTCRMATEIFLKAYIALKTGLTPKQAKKELGHDLGKAFDRFVEVSGYTIWVPLKERLSVFPPVDARYDRQELPRSSAWKGFAFAQSIGTVIVREHTGRDTISQLMTVHNPPRPMDKREQPSTGEGENR